MQIGLWLKVLVLRPQPLFGEGGGSERRKTSIFYNSKRLCDGHAIGDDEQIGDICLDVTCFPNHPLRSLGIWRQSKYWNIMAYGWHYETRGFFGKVFVRTCWPIWLLILKSPSCITILNFIDNDKEHSCNAHAGTQVSNLIYEENVNKLHIQEDCLSPRVHHIQDSSSSWKLDPLLLHLSSLTLSNANFILQ